MFLLPFSFVKGNVNLPLLIQYLKTYQQHSDGMLDLFSALSILDTQRLHYLVFVLMKFLTTIHLILPCEELDIVDHLCTWGFLWSWCGGRVFESMKPEMKEIKNWMRIENSSSRLTHTLHPHRPYTQHANPLKILNLFVNLFKILHKRNLTQFSLLAVI